MPSRMSVGDALSDYSSELAGAFSDVPLPYALPEPASAMPHASVDVGDPTDHPSAPLADPGGRVAILVGPAATREAWALHSLASHLGAPVANTWGAKGIYPWDNPHHMGTCGLQRDDFPLLGFADYDLVLAVGIDESESPPERFALTSSMTIGANHELFEAIQAATPARSFAPEPNELYRRIAAIAQPGYVDDSFPRHPARAVMDLKQSLAPDTRVTAQPGPAGLWVARTFPTDRMGSVIVPAVDRSGVAAAVGLLSAAGGTDTVCVVAGGVDDVSAEVLTVAADHGLPLRVEVWGDDVDWSRTEDLIAAAGPVVAWTA